MIERDDDDFNSKQFDKKVSQCENRVVEPQKLHIDMCVGACEKRRPPPLREHRKLETIQRLHAGFSSKLFPPQQPASRAGPAPDWTRNVSARPGYL